MSSPTKPNIVVIWAPDVEASQLGCYRRGRSNTPNIDSLAREGMLFNNSALEAGGAAAVEFMSGQSTAPGTLARAGVSPNVVRRDATLAVLLRARGYATGQFGGMRPDVLEDCLVCLDGFDEIAGWPRPARAAGEAHRSGASAPSARAELPWWARFGHRSEAAASFPGDGSELSDEEIVALALRFMRRQHALGTPFFAWIRATHTHSVARRGAGTLSSRAGRLAAHDRNVGDVLEQLDLLGLGDDTFVIYSAADASGTGVVDPTDVSEVTAPSEQTPIAVARDRPLLVRWPGRIAAGSTCNGLVHYRDWLPTLLAVAGGSRSRERFGSASSALRARDACVLGSNVLPFLVGDAPARAPSGLAYFDDDGGLLTFRYDNWEVRRCERPAPLPQRSRPPRARRINPRVVPRTGGLPSPAPAARISAGGWASRRRLSRGAHHRAGER
jgi:arylsulfatase